MTQHAALARQNRAGFFIVFCLAQKAKAEHRQNTNGRSERAARFSSMPVMNRANRRTLFCAFLPKAPKTPFLKRFAAQGPTAHERTSPRCANLNASPVFLPTLHQRCSTGHYPSCPCNCASNSDSGRRGQHNRCAGGRRPGGRCGPATAISVASTYSARQWQPMENGGSHAARSG